MKSRSVILGALLAAALAAAAPASAARPAAVEEYVLTLPGATRAGADRTDPLVSRARDAGPIGVTGERESDPPLAGSLVSALASPSGIVLVAAVAGAVGLSVRTSRRRR